MEGFFYFCGKLKTTSFSWYAYLQPDMETATLLGDKKLENEAISLLKSCLINHQLLLVVVGGRIHWSRCSIQSRPRTYLYAQI